MERDHLHRHKKRREEEASVTPPAQHLNRLHPAPPRPSPPPPPRPSQALVTPLAQEHLNRLHLAPPRLSPQPPRPSPPPPRPSLLDRASVTLPAQHLNRLHPAPPRPSPPPPRPSPPPPPRPSQASVTPLAQEHLNRLHLAPPRLSPQPPRPSPPPPRPSLLDSGTAAVDNFTIFGNVNPDVEGAANFLKKRNYGIIIRDERELNIIRARKAAEKRSEACTSRKGKEKLEERNANVSKAAISQRLRREREKNERPSIQPIPTPHQLHSILPPQRTPITLESVPSNMQAPPQLEVPFDLSPRNLGKEFLATNLNEQILEHAPSKASLAQRLRRDKETNECPSELNLGRQFLGRMDVTCPYCKALHWMDEKLTNSSCKYPLFGTCCLQGKIRLPALLTPPPELALLYDGDDDKSKSFRRYTREYNAANAFTSLGVQMDDRVLSGRGPTSFTIHGELRHRTGTLLPQSGQDARYAQLYIYDPEAALDIRSRRNSHLRRDVLERYSRKFVAV